MIQLQQLRRVMNEIAKEKGEFVLFGLFLRDEAMDKWDLVISAPWLEEGKLKGLGEFVEKMATIVGEEQLLSFSRIVTLNHDEPSLKAILGEVQVENDFVEMKGNNLFGLPINHAYILQAKPQLSIGSKAA
jgi:hypothetical protein